MKVNAVKLFLACEMKLCQCNSGVYRERDCGTLSVASSRTGGYCSGFSGITGFMFVRVHSLHLHVQVLLVGWLVGAQRFNEIEVSR